MPAHPSFIRAHADGVYLALKVQPRASCNEISGIHGDALKIKVTAPPVDSAANEAVLRFLAEVLGCPRNALQLVRGETARHKLVFIRDLGPDQLLSRLPPLAQVKS